MIREYRVVQNLNYAIHTGGKFAPSFALDFTKPYECGTYEEIKKLLAENKNNLSMVAYFISEIDLRKEQPDPEREKKQIRPGFLLALTPTEKYQLKPLGENGI